MADRVIGSVVAATPQPAATEHANNTTLIEKLLIS
jgi:hypothetical protein